MTKLTKPQRELLGTARDDAAGYLDCAPEYTPARRLVALGFATVVTTGLSDRVKITAAGADWLEKNDPDVLSEFCRELLKAGVK